MLLINRVSVRRWGVPGLLCLALSAPVPGVCAASVETGFSPEGTALQLVLKTIVSARKEIRLMGYSFTSPEVVTALMAAHRRGVDVKVVLDERGNHGKSSVAAINLLLNAGIPVRLNGHYKIQHDKIVVTDRDNVETGSFNFSRAAARSNSENVLVLRDMPEVASQYLAHWQRRWEEGRPATKSY
ncbi:phospholipase D family protein [Buttiauxella sp. B2]|uniref:phospholipase D family nuclease n=1 Tax=Buttiauxella sp. B2 TaxID=2587812 RepID=UPI0011200C5D|nr:phospholipase D family protein [Buttiauxella sp. B2]TNV10477.1 phospholipase D family protein [Buttiauxella sp. B2]